MAQILHQVIGGQAMMAFWYHFAILFEALFILTAVDAGTRAGRFMLQDLLGVIHPSLRRTESLPANLVATALCVAAWGYFLYQGVVDPLGGINTLWPLFGISNQMLAGIALMLGTVVLFRMKRERFAWVTIAPTVWLLACTLTAGLQKILPGSPKVSFMAHAEKLSATLAEGKLAAPAKSVAQMRQMIFNDYVDAGLTALFILVMASVVVYGVMAILRARGIATPTVNETPYAPMPASAQGQGG
jgi:carbon starvation protein